MSEKYKEIARSEHIPGDYEGDMEELFRYLIAGMLEQLIEAPLRIESLREEQIKMIVNNFAGSAHREERGHISRSIELGVGGFLVRQSRKGKKEAERWLFEADIRFNDEQLQYVVNGAENLSRGDKALLRNIKKRGCF